MKCSSPKTGLKLSALNGLSVALLLAAGLIWPHAGSLENSQHDSPLAHADDTDPCDNYYADRQNLTEDIFEENGLNVDLGFSDVFQGNPDKPQVKNLYLNVYKMIKNTPDDQALQNTADSYQYTQTEMCTLLSGGYDILAKTNDESLDILEAAEIVSEMQETYQREFDKAQREQEMFLDSYAKEIFANGDTSDSSFDVLYDLEIIEYLLFGEEGASGSSATDDVSDGADSGGDGGDGDGDSGEDEGESDDSRDSGDSGASSSRGDEDGSDSGSDGDEGAVDPMACRVDSELQHVLEAFIDPDASDEGDDDTSSSDSGGSSGGGSSGDSAGDTPDGDDSSSDSGQLIASTPHDWTRPEVCDAVFCLFINFINDDDSEYEESSNCIKCHMEYIVQVLDETTSKTLVPGKVSGNLFEPSLCKNDLLQVDVGLNFIFMPMPLQTPPADELVTGLNFCDNVDDFVDSEHGDLLMTGLFADVCSDEEPNEELTEEQERALRTFVSGLDDAVKRQTTISDSSVSTDELVDEALTEYANRIADLEQSFRDSYTTSRAAVGNDFYQSMSYEMDQMNEYFKAFFEAISLSHDTAERLQNSLQPAS